MANRKKRKALEEQERSKEEKIKKYFKESKQKKVLNVEDSLKSLNLIQKNEWAYKKLFAICQEQRTKFFENRRAVASYECNVNNTFTAALAAISLFSGSWIRKPEDWSCKTYNVDRQFSSLVRHLFAKYKVPTFFDTVWFTKWTEWFVLIGQGINVRKIKNIPINLTKKMAHEMMKAPNDYTIEQALRWGQIQGLGGDERLIRAINSTKLGIDFHNEEFWITVIHWLINQPMLDMIHVNPIIDYINNQKFIPVGRVIENDEVVDRGVPQPDFKMKGRTVDVLLRKIREWHGDLNKTKIKEHIKWDPCVVKPFEVILGKKEPKIWRIVELLDNIDLMKEGRAMKHCASSYVSSCKRRASAIFSMTCNNARMLTIEVNLQTMDINQIRGKQNRFSTPAEMRVIRSWAVKEGLGFSRWVRGIV